MRRLGLFVCFLLVCQWSVLSSPLSAQDIQNRRPFSFAFTGEYALILDRLQTPYLGWGIGGRAGYDVSEKIYLGAKFLYDFGGTLDPQRVLLYYLEEPKFPVLYAYDAKLWGHSFYATVDAGYYFLHEKSVLFNGTEVKIKALLGLGYLRFATSAEVLGRSDGVIQNGIAITPGVLGTIQILDFGFAGLELGLDVRYHIGVLLPSDPPRATASVPGTDIVLVAEASVAGQDIRKVNVNQTFSFNFGLGFCF